MGFLNPLNLAYLLSIGVLVLIYFYARSQLTLDVSSLMLFEKVEQPITRPRFARVDLLFWLELLALAALSLALAGLYLKLAPAPHRVRRHALIFDLAASMGAREGRQTRLDQAKRQALAIISSAPAGDQFDLLAYAQEAERIHVMTADRGAIKDAIGPLSAIAVAARPAALAGALMLAREADLAELFANRLPSGTGELASATRLRFHAIGSTDDNVAIVSLDPGIPGRTRGRCLIRNFSSEGRMPEIRIDRDGSEIYHSSVFIPDHREVVVDFGPLPSGGVLHAKLLGGDALEADNQRWTYAPKSRAFHVLVVSPDASAREDLARVLHGLDPNLIVMAADPARVREAAGNAHLDLLVLHDSADPKLQADSRLLVYPASASEFEVSASVTASVLEERQGTGMLSHPILLGAARVLTLPVWMEPIARGNGAGHRGTFPLAAVGANNSGRLGVIAFDIRNHLLLDPDRLDALVVTVDALKVLSAPQGLYIAQTGNFVNIPAVGQVRMTQPDGNVVRLTPNRWGQVRFRPLQAGRYKISSDTGTQQLFANYYDSAESDLTPKVPRIKTASAGAGELAAAAMPRVRPISLGLIALATAMFVAESLLLARRAIAGAQHHV